MEFLENWFVDYILKRKINFSFKKKQKKKRGTRQPTCGHRTPSFPHALGCLLVVEKFTSVCYNNSNSRICECYKYPVMGGEIMTNDEIFFKSLYTEQKNLSKKYGLKYAPRFHGVYNIENDFIWRARIIPGFLSKDNTLDLKMVVSCGAVCFDTMLVSIISPNENRKITELNHAAGIYVGPILELSEKTYHFPCDTDDEAVHSTTDLLIKEALETISGFEKEKLSKHGDIVTYMQSLKETQPMECGFAHLVKKDYPLAENYFRYAEESCKFWHISYTSKARLLHSILIDYCYAMQKGIEWKEEYIENGLNA